MKNKENNKPSTDRNPLEPQDSTDIGDSKVPATNQVWRLVVAMSDSGDLGTKYPIFKHETTIGRSKHSDIQVHSKFISRVHARIIEDERGALIEDTGSTNGVTVNASRISGQQQRLHDGDTISVGEHKFKFVEQAPA